MNFVLHPWYIVLLTASRNFNDTDADDYLRGTALELIGKHHGAFDKSAHVGDVTVTIIKPKRIEDYTDEELGEIIARGESERAGDEQAANIDLNLDG